MPFSLGKVRFPCWDHPPTSVSSWIPNPPCPLLTMPCYCPECSAISAWDIWKKPKSQCLRAAKVEEPFIFCILTLPETARMQRWAQASSDFCAYQKNQNNCEGAVAQTCTAKSQIAMLRSFPGSVPFPVEVSIDQELFLLAISHRLEKKTNPNQPLLNRGVFIKPIKTRKGL